MLEETRKRGLSVILTARNTLFPKEIKGSRQNVRQKLNLQPTIVIACLRSGSCRQWKIVDSRPLPFSHQFANENKREARGWSGSFQPRGPRFSRFCSETSVPHKRQPAGTGFHPEVNDYSKVGWNGCWPGARCERRFGRPAKSVNSSFGCQRAPKSM